MPRYFFDIADGRCEADEIGVTLASAVDARREALRRSAILMRVTRSKDREGTVRAWTIGVKDETGQMVFKIEGRSGMIEATQHTRGDG